MRELQVEETQAVSAGLVSTQTLLMATIAGMVIGGGIGGYIAMQYAMSSASQVVLTPLVAATCAGMGGTTGLGIGLSI